jgi:hypothetical protein
MQQRRSVSHVSVSSVLVLTALLACKKEEATPTPPATAATATTPSTAATATGDVKLGGNYDATGTNPEGGGTYSAKLLVTPRDDVYQFSWDSSGKKYDGVGVMTGNTVAVSYTDGADGKGCGVVLYSVGSDGTLDGKAGYWGVNKGETEKATRKSGSDLDGSYEVEGKNTDGKAYKGTLAIAKDGIGYSFKWNVGAAFEGYGIKQGDKAIVGFGGKQCGFVAYETKSDGTLEGKWGGQSTKSLGTETAKKK